MNVDEAIELVRGAVLEQLGGDIERLAGTVAATAERLEQLKASRRDGLRDKLSPLPASSSS